MCFFTALGTTIATSIGLSVGTAAAAAASTTVITTGTATAIGVAATAVGALAIGGAITGGVMGTVSAVQQAQMQEEQANFYAEQEAKNAQLARKEAEAIEVMGNQEKAKLRTQMLAQKGQARTQYAAGNVVLGSGTSADYEADIADAYDLDSRNLEYDIESRKWQTHVRAANATSQSAMYRSQASSFSSGKTLSLLGGIASTTAGTIKTTYGVGKALKGMA